MSRAERDAQFTEFLHARRAWLRRIAYLLHQDASRAAELTEDVLLSVYRGWHKAQRSGDLDAHVRSILVRRFLASEAGLRGAWRSRGRRTSGQPDASPALELISALGDLTPRQRAAIVLTFYCELPTAEVARMLQTSEASVDSLTAGGLTLLQRALGALPAPEGRTESQYAD